MHNVIDPPRTNAVPPQQLDLEGHEASDQIASEVRGIEDQRQPGQGPKERMSDNVCIVWVMAIRAIAWIVMTVALGLVSVASSPARLCEGVVDDHVFVECVRVAND